MASRFTLCAGLTMGAAGIAILWAAGVDFPVAIPPGLVILLAGVALVALARARWADAVGGLLGLFIVCGFLLSGVEGEGFDNLLGENGAAVAVGQVVELAGAAVAVAGGALLVVRRPGAA